MALRSVTIAGTAPVQLDPTATVQQVCCDGPARQELLDRLVAEGWRVMGTAGLPDTVDDTRLNAARGGAALGIDVAEAFLEAVRAEEVVTRTRCEELRAAAGRTEAMVQRAGALRDHIIEQLGHGAVLAETSEAVWRPVVDELAALDEQALADQLRAWLDDAVAGRAPLHPTAAELLARRDDLDRRWADVGEGAFQSTASVAAAREERDRLRELVRELESQLGRGLAEDARLAIEAAHTARVECEEGLGRRGSRTEVARQVEDEILARYGFASYTDFQISTSTGSVGDHAQQVLPNTVAALDAASDALRAEIERVEAAGRAVEHDREALRSAIAEWCGDHDPAGILAPPSAAESAVAALARRLDQLTAEHAQLDQGVAAASIEATELGEETAVRAEELDASKRLVEELDRLVAEVDVRRQAALAALAEALADTTVPGVVIDARAALLEVSAVVELIERAAAQRVVVLT